MTIRNMDILSQSSQHMGVIATDQTGVITVFNAGAEDLLGYEAKSLISKMNINSLLGTDMADIASLIQIAEHDNNRPHDHAIQLANGEQSNFQLDISKITGEDDKFTGLLIMLSRAAGEDFVASDLIDHSIFEKILVREFKRMQRSELPIGLVKISIDHADKLSQQLGDEVWSDTINQIALTLFQRVQRAGDVLAYGGATEFLLLLPQTDVAGAVKLSEILRLIVQHSGLTTDTNSDQVSISLGIACMSPSQNDTEADLLGHTAQALALAIKEGGNCSRLAQINCTSE